MNKICYLLSNFLLKNTLILKKFISRYKEIDESPFRNIDIESISKDDENTSNDLQQMINIFFQKIFYNKSEQDLFFIYSLMRKAAGDDFIRLKSVIDEGLKSATVESNINSSCIIDIKPSKMSKIKIFYIEKLKKVTQKPKIKTDRNSVYRGISKNGYKWQVLLKNKKRFYYGSYDTEIQAAKVYDICALKHFGLKAKTNFHYTEKEKLNLMNSYVKRK